MAHTTEAARQVLVQAWPGTVPYSQALARYVLAVARHETGYGEGWSGAGRGSHNMGAITTGSSWSGDRFRYGDSRPSETGDVAYETDFRKYPSDGAGLADLVRVLARVVERSGIDVDAVDARGFAQAMYDQRYYMGLAADTPSQRVDRYARALSEGLRRQARTDPGASSLVWDGSSRGGSGGPRPRGALAMWLTLGSLLGAGWYVGRRLL